MNLYEMPVMKKRFSYLLRVIQLVHAYLFLFVFSNNLATEDFWGAFNLNAILDLSMIFGMQILINLIKKDRISLAVNLYISITLCFLIMAAIISEGLSSIAMTAFPLTLLLVSLYTKKSSYLIYFVVVLITLFGIGLNDIYGWIAPQIEAADVEGERFKRLLVVYIFTGCLAWMLIRDLKFAYTEKLKERQRIVEANEQIQALADTDQLTGLLNRYGAKNKFASLLEQTDFEQESILLLFVDIDDFKSINDQYGHHIGDETLLLIGQRLQQLIGQDALISRLGGDEFVVAITHNKDFDVDAFLEKILSRVSIPILAEGRSVEITTSIGIATADSPEHSFGELCRMADMAMYQVKVDGKNHYHHYHIDLEKAYMTNLNIIKSMQNAVENSALDLFYQPKLNTSTNQVVGAEALLHWERFNPEGYTLSEVMPVVETTNLIHEIGYWVLRKACTDCKLWHDKGFKLPVSVNVVARQLADQTFASQVKNIIQEVGLPATYLVLEITEDDLVKGESDGMAQLHEVKALGVKLAIDRFGVGYSNMAYLTDLQVDELKIDSDFTQSLSSSVKAQSVVSAFVKMAKQLGIQMVALGVEKEEDNRSLKAMGCEIGQGFLWHKPVALSDYLALLNKQSLALN